MESYFKKFFIKIISERHFFKKICDFYLIKIEEYFINDGFKKCLHEAT